MKTPAAPTVPSTSGRTLSTPAAVFGQSTFSFLATVTLPPLLTVTQSERFLFPRVPGFPRTLKTQMLTFPSQVPAIINANDLANAAHARFSADSRFAFTRINPLLSTPNPLEIRVIHLNPLRKNNRASTVPFAVYSRLQICLTNRSDISLIVRLLRRFIGPSQNSFPFPQMSTFTMQVTAFTIFTLKNSISSPLCGLDRSKGSANFTGSVYKRPCAGTGRRRSIRRRRTLSLVNGKISTRNPRLENGRGFFVNLAPQ